MGTLIEYAIGAALAVFFLADPTKVRHFLFKLRGRDATGERK